MGTWNEQSAVRHPLRRGARDQASVPGCRRYSKTGRSRRTRAATEAGGAGSRYGRVHLPGYPCGGGRRQRSEALIRTEKSLTWGNCKAPRLLRRRSRARRRPYQPLATRQQTSTGRARTDGLIPPRYLGWHLPRAARTCMHPVSANAMHFLASAPAGLGCFPPPIVQWQRPESLSQRARLLSHRLCPSGPGAARYLRLCQTRTTPSQLPRWGVSYRKPGCVTRLPEPFRASGITRFGTCLVLDVLCLLAVPLSSGPLFLLLLSCRPFCCPLSPRRLTTCAGRPSSRRMLTGLGPGSPR